MHLLHVMKTGSPVFILVLPFDQKDTARAYGFTWNNPQPGAWATDSLSVAVSPIKDGAEINVNFDTLIYLKEHTAMSEATYERLAAEYVQPDRKAQAGINAATLSEAQVEAIHAALKGLAGDCDGAAADDQLGFNRNDVEYGHRLADKQQLTRTDAGYGSLLLYKYRGQIGDDLFSVIFPDVFKREQQAAQDKADKAAQKVADRAEKKAEKAAPKLHKAGQFCDWSGCTACKSARPVVEILTTSPMQKAILEDAADQIRKHIALPASSVYFPDEAELDAATENYYNDLLSIRPQPLGQTIIGFDPAAGQDVTKTVIYDQMKGSIVAVQDTADDVQAEVIRLATSLIDCYPQDFDTTVDFLRALRKIDAPKDAKSDFTKAAWSAAGYDVKK